MDLNKRVADLEKRATPVKKEEPTIPSIDKDVVLATLAAVLMDEPPERKEILTLEERLAIARREAVPKPEVWADRRDPSLANLRYQPIPKDTGPANTARELEIMILQRDGKITPPEATRLRGGRLELELPFPVVIENEDAFADEALRKCPPRENLPLEDQLRLETQELEESKALHAQFGFDDEPSGIRHQRIAELQRKIADRDQKRCL